jgi:hypothetical protein
MAEENEFTVDGVVEEADVDQPKGRARGGLARAQKLSAEERRSIARRAASTRWHGDIPEATHEGSFPIGGKILSVAVLADGRRIITQAAFLRLLGRARSPKAGTGVWSTADNLPFFLQAETLKDLISDEVRASTKPIFYRAKGGGKGVGYDANLLPGVCEVYLKLRDQHLVTSGKQPERYKDIITAADIVMRALAHVGISALVDEATGYQEIRDRKALQEILNQYIGAELAKWAKRFPDEFYAQIFRLKGMKHDPKTSRRPHIMAQITVDLVYDRIGPGLTQELRDRRQKALETTGKKGKLQQLLTPDVGHPALQHHLSGIIFLAKVYPDGGWDGFYEAMGKVAPKYNQTLFLPFDEVDSTSSTSAQVPLFLQ